MTSARKKRKGWQESMKSLLDAGAFLDAHRERHDSVTPPSWSGSSVR